MRDYAQFLVRLGRYARLNANKWFILLGLQGFYGFLGYKTDKNCHFDKSARSALLSQHKYQFEKNMILWLTVFVFTALMGILSDYDLGLIADHKSNCEHPS